MKRPRGFPLAATLPAVLLAGCLTTPPSVELAKSLRVGGPCRYDTAIGTARIIDLRAAPGSVEMTLTLSMPAAFNPAAWWNREEMRVMVLGPASGADARWLAAQGMQPGVTHPVELSVIREGTCTPVLVRFPGRPWVVQ